MRLSEEVRLRFREEMERRKMSQRDLAGILNWSQSRVAHLLTGRITMGVDDLAEMSWALGTRPTEMIRDRGLEFVSEMTPSEMRVFEWLRALSPERRHAFYQFFGVPEPTPDSNHVPNHKQPRLSVG